VNDSAFWVVWAGGGSFVRRVARAAIRSAHAARDALRGRGPTLRGR